MATQLTVPRLAFGIGAIECLGDEVRHLGMRRPLLVSDRGLERAGIVAIAQRLLPTNAAIYLDTEATPTLAGAEAAFAAYKDNGCDGVVALGGGSVLDTAKFLAALAGDPVARASELIGNPTRIGAVAPLIAIPTTIGSGSECSPVSALHPEAGVLAIGTRSALLVPSLAICDPGLTRSLPRRLIAATGIDALAHCIEGFLSEPAHPVIDALALDGMARVFKDIHAAMEPDGDVARGSLMAAAFAGGAAINKGLGPAHAVALVCGTQDHHHGTLVGIALPLTSALVVPHATEKAKRIEQALGLTLGVDLADALRTLMRSVELPARLVEIGYKAGSIEELAAGMAKSPFNLTSPYKPGADEYRAILLELLDV